MADTVEYMDLLQIAKSYLAEVGIEMEIRKMETTAWNAFVLIDHKHDQMAHRPGGPLGKCSTPIINLAQFQKGGRLNWAMVDDPGFNTFLPKVMATTNVNDMKKVIRDANEYVARQHYAIALLQPQAYSLCQPWLKGFNAQFGSAWAHAGGPAMLSFYLGRFWIDQNLKKSMGHQVRRK